MFKLPFAGYINTPADLSPSHNFIKFAFSSQQNEDFVVEKCMIYVFMFFFRGSTTLTAFLSSKRSDLQKAIFARLVSAHQLSQS